MKHGVALSLLLACVLPATAEAGPWTKGQGQFYVKLSEGFFLSDTFVDNTGTVVKGVDHLSATTALYAEVGLIESLHLQLYLPYTIGRNDEPGGNSFISSGGGDAQLGLQWSPGLISWPHAITVLAKVPLYDVSGVKGFLAPRFPARGDGQLDFTVSASIGKGFGPAYAFIDLGHQFRTEVFVGQGDTRTLGDSFVGNAQVGITVIGRLVVAGNVGGVLPYTKDNITKGFLTLGPSIYFPFLGGLAAEANADFLVLARNSALGLSYHLGLSYNR